MGDDKIKTYAVETVRGNLNVYAGSLSFTVSGDLVFEDVNREFLQSFARGYWHHVEEIKVGN